jgi:hypothetical protein
VRIPVVEPDIFFRARYSPQRECSIGGFTLSRWSSEAKFVAIRIGQVKEQLTPFGIARCRFWSIAGCDHATRPFPPNGGTILTLLKVQLTGRFVVARVGLPRCCG